MADADEGTRPVEASTDLSGDGNLQITGERAFTNSTGQGNRFSKAEATSLREDRDQEHRHEEERRDREAARWRERWLFLSVLIGTGAVALIGFGLALFPDNATTREFGRAIVFALLGAVAGAFGGYATGRSRS